MRLLSSKSEYLGTRIAMHDALQRYYASAPADLPDDKKVELLQQCVQNACNENSLLGTRKEIVGKAWAEFLGTRDPASIAAFVADADVIAYSAKEPQISTIASSLNFIRALGLLTKSRNFAFEKVAQRTGLIDYEHGETLSRHLATAEQRLVQAGEQAIPKSSELPGNLTAIKKSFDTEYGQVDPADLGLLPHQMGNNRQR